MRVKTWAIQTRQGFYVNEPYCGGGFKTLTFKTRKHAQAWLDEQTSLSHFWRAKGVRIVKVVITIEETL